MKLFQTVHFGKYFHTRFCADRTYVTIFSHSFFKVKYQSLSIITVVPSWESQITSMASSDPHSLAAASKTRSGCDTILAKRFASNVLLARNKQGMCSTKDRARFVQRIEEKCIICHDVDLFCKVRILCLPGIVTTMLKLIYDSVHWFLLQDKVPVDLLSSSIQ